MLYQRNDAQSEDTELCRMSMNVEVISTRVLWRRLLKLD